MHDDGTQARAQRRAGRQMDPLTPTQRALNPLFLRDAELERSLSLLTLLQLELEAMIAGPLERIGLEPADAVLLARVEQAARQSEPVTAAELAAFLGWTKQRMSRRLASLAGRGLVDRRPAAGDKRKHYLAATEAGLRHVEEVRALQKRHLKRIFRRAGPAEVAGFQNVLTVAAQHAGKSRQAVLQPGLSGGFVRAGAHA